MFHAALCESEAERAVRRREDGRSKVILNKVIVVTLLARSRSGAWRRERPASARARRGAVRGAKLASADIATLVYFKSSSVY